VGHLGAAARAARARGGHHRAPRRSFLWRFPSAELLEVARRFDVSEDDTLVLRLDYLEAVVRKPAWL
jgi:hypothetical protein